MHLSFTQLTLFDIIQWIRSRCIVSESFMSFGLFLEKLGVRKFQKMSKSDNFDLEKTLSVPKYI